MSTTSINQSVLETDVFVQTLTLSSATILNNQWQVCCMLIPESLVATYFVTPGSVVTGEFAILSKNTYGTEVLAAFLDAANTFYNQVGNATLAYIVFDDTDWATLTPSEREQVLAPIAKTIQERTNYVLVAIEDATQYGYTSDAIDVVAKSHDFYTGRIAPVPADTGGVDTLSAYMEAQLKTSIVLNNTYTMDGRPDIAGAAGGLQSTTNGQGVTLRTGHTWQGNPLTGVSPSFVSISSALLNAIKLSPLSFTQREVTEEISTSNTVVYMGGWAYGGYTDRTPISYLIFNTYARINLRNNVLPLITRRETRPVTSDDVNSISAIMSAILEPFVNTIIEVNTLIIKSYTPTDIQSAIQTGTLELVLNEMIKYRLPKVTQSVNITIVAEAA